MPATSISAASCSSGSAATSASGWSTRITGRSAASLLAAGIGVSALALHLRARHPAAARRRSSRSPPSASSRACRLSCRISSRGAAPPASTSRPRCSRRSAVRRSALWVIYFAVVATMGLSLYLSYGIKISKFGLGLLAIGQNEDAAAILGVPTPRYKALCLQRLRLPARRRRRALFFQERLHPAVRRVRSVAVDRSAGGRHAGRAGHRHRRGARRLSLRRAARLSAWSPKPSRISSWSSPACCCSSSCCSFPAG